MNTNSMKRTSVRQTGLSMIELLVALAIGSFLIIGAVTLQSQTRRNFDVGEQQARLQESARYVLSVIEPDLQLAGVFGYTPDPSSVMWLNGGALTPPSQLRMSSATAPGLPASARTCGGNFAVDILSTVAATNGAFDLVCAAQGGGAVAGTDLLVLRHASTLSSVASSTKLQVFSDRLAAQTNTRLFNSSTAPDPVKAGEREVRDLIVQAYYIAKDADGHPGVPALRVKSLTTDGAQPVFVDQELIRGVEDLQVQFGVDPGEDLDGDGVGDDPSGDGMADFVNGNAAQYVNAGDPLLNSAQVVSVRIWVRVRADAPQRGFVDGHEYLYADTDFTPNDNFRRVVMARTIYLRNSRLE
jgi:type IV pilus assembly protein PilW